MGWGVGTYSSALRYRCVKDSAGGIEMRGRRDIGVGLGPVGVGIFGYTTSCISGPVCKDSFGVSRPRLDVPTPDTMARVGGFSKGCDAGVLVGGITSVEEV